ncbi:hypothetical protein SMD22_01220 (plasmid) [Brevibacillus halotolerans]|nr:hypothetical protein SMD22_01220 [Brevibacillus halotolerans]
MIRKLANMIWMLSVMLLPYPIYLTIQTNPNAMGLWIKGLWAFIQKMYIEMYRVGIVRKYLTKSKKKE